MPSRTSRDWRLRIQDILQAAQDVADFTAGLSFEEFEENKMLVQSVLYNFVIIGEATANIPEEIKQQYALSPFLALSWTHVILLVELELNLGFWWWCYQPTFILLKLSNFLNLCYIVMGKTIVEKIKSVVTQLVIMRIFHNPVAIARPGERNGHNFTDVSAGAIGHHDEAIA